MRDIHTLLDKFAKVALIGLALAVTTGSWAASTATDAESLVIAVSAEYGVQGSHAAQSIEKGVRLAVEEINAAGGVLNGRKLEVETRDDRGVPARAADNLIELAARPNVIAVFCGRFSPVALELVPVANREKILLLDPWAAADGITTNPEGSYIFRLSLSDTWAINKMMKHAQSRGHKRLAILIPNTAWGRSSLAAANNFRNSHPAIQLTAHWYNWGDTQFGELFQKLLADNTQTLLMVANEAEGTYIVRQMAALPKEQRIPVLSHWGIAGGDFARLAGPALDEVDLLVIQSFTFSGATSAKALAVSRAYETRFNDSIRNLRAQIGFAHGYDLTHLLAQAIRLADSADRSKIRSAMEKIGTHDGLMMRYQKPFSPRDHEALTPAQAKLMRLAPTGEFQEISAR